jgi:hypothetical protein
MTRIKLMISRLINHDGVSGLGYNLALSQKLPLSSRAQRGAPNFLAVKLKCRPACTRIGRSVDMFLPVMAVSGSTESIVRLFLQVILPLEWEDRQRTLLPDNKARCMWTEICDRSLSGSDGSILMMCCVNGCGFLVLLCSQRSWKRWWHASSQDIV